MIAVSELTTITIDGFQWGRDYQTPKEGKHSKDSFHTLLEAHQIHLLLSQR